MGDLAESCLLLRLEGAITFIIREDRLNVFLSVADRWRNQQAIFLLHDLLLFFLAWREKFNFLEVSKLRVSARDYGMIFFSYSTPIVVSSHLVVDEGRPGIHLSDCGTDWQGWNLWRAPMTFILRVRSIEHCRSSKTLTDTSRHTVLWALLIGKSSLRTVAASICTLTGRTMLVVILVRLLGCFIISVHVSAVVLF